MSGGLPTGSSRAVTVACAVLVALVTWLLAVHLSTSPPWAAVDARVLEHVRPGPPAARLMRGALAYLAMPLVLSAGAVAVVALWRREPRTAVALVLTAAATSVLVQAVKHSLVPVSTWVNPLSGHTAVSAGLGLAWLALGPGRLGRLGRGPVAVIVGLVVGAVAAGNVLAGWHAVHQVALPLGVATCAALLARVWAGPVGLAPGQRRGASVALVAGAATAAVGILLGERTTPSGPLSAAVLACVLVVVGAVAAAVAGGAPPEPGAGATPRS